jgi:hypothetical protein
VGLERLPRGDSPFFGADSKSQCDAENTTLDPYFTSIHSRTKVKQAATNREEEHRTFLADTTRSQTAFTYAAAMTASRKEIKVGILGATGMSPLVAFLL